MATGGIGGVHRGFPHPPDVSADLGELARTPALVVSAGVKSLLDVPGDGGAARVARRAGARLPRRHAASLLRRAGGPPVSARVESAEEAARVAAAHWELGGAGLLARPASRRAARGRRAAHRGGAAPRRPEGVSGQAVTPFVLSYLHRESGGRTEEANRALVAQNARLAGEVALVRSRRWNASTASASATQR